MELNPCYRHATRTSRQPILSAFVHCLNNPQPYSFDDRIPWQVYLKKPNKYNITLEKYEVNCGFVARRTSELRQCFRFKIAMSVS